MKKTKFPQLRINQRASPSVREAFPTESSALLSELRIPVMKTLTFTQDGGSAWSIQGNSRMARSGKTTAKGHSVWVPCTGVPSWAGTRRWHYQVSIFILGDQLKQSRTSILILIQLYHWMDKCSDCSSLFSAGVTPTVLGHRNDHLQCRVPGRAVSEAFLSCFEQIQTGYGTQSY